MRRKRIQTHQRNIPLTSQVSAIGIDWLELQHNAYFFACLKKQIKGLSLAHHTLAYKYIITSEIWRRNFIFKKRQ